MFRGISLTLALVGAVAVATPAFAAERPAAGEYENQVRPLLVKYCQGCHGDEKAKGDFRVDQLSPRFGDKVNRERWQLALKRITAGEMPPKAKPRPPDKDAQALVDWIRSQTEAAHAAEGRVALRRLNRAEYENTVRDLLGITVNLKEQLPQDVSANGFDNAAAALHTSSFLMEKYLEAADTALNLAITNRPKPPPLLHKRYLVKDQHQVKTTTESVFRKLDDAVVLFCSSPWQAITLYEFYPSDRGRYRFRVSVSGFQSQGKPVTFRIGAGSSRLAGKSGLVGYFDAPADKPTVFEFVETMEPRTTISILPYGLASAQSVHKVGADAWEGPGLAIQWIEVEGPLHDTWPPTCHRRIFGDLEQVRSPGFNQPDRVEVGSQDPEADARRILRAFARRAFRRTVTDAEVQPYLTLVTAKLAEKRTFEQAVRAGLLALMVSPDFLFLREKPGKLDDFALASRLSYFLWSTMPDEELLTLAEQGKLSRPDVLHGQVERMLKDPKASAFTENFVGQWLGLRDIDFTEPSHILYPEFDHMLKVSMIRETELFFTEVLNHDLCLTNFVASDFTMLNGRLAKHYGIPGVDGWEFQKVKLPPDSHRGGVLTMASVLKVTANGTTTSPVVRGAWVLDRILGTPPPRPPADVPAVEPDIRGATTIREQLAKHRQFAACATCHSKIDPPGFALESFDVIGGWRENYRTTGTGSPVIVDGRRMAYHQGRKVDPSDVMADGQRFANIDEFKQMLLKDRDQVALSLAEKLLTYATGAAPEAAARPEVAAIVGKVRDKHYGFRSLLHEVVQSKLFQTK
jgi:mono/diheme cytochrome c family protein